MINSIGTATPAHVGSVAKGLGLAIEDTIKAVYRAPIILASKLELAAAEKLKGMLVSLGFEISIHDDAQAKPAPNPLFDVVLRLGKPEMFFEVSKQLSEFCGTSLAEIQKLVATPPGLVLGGVSEATIDALNKRLDGLGTILIKSRPQKARYDLFSHGLPDTLAQRLRSELKIQGAEASGSIFATDIDYAEANGLWRKYGRTGNVTIVDRLFQNFDIVLEDIEDRGDAVKQAALLENLFGIPSDLFQKLAGAGEVILASCRSYGQFEQEIEELAQIGIWARVDLMTFAQRAVSISEIDNGTAAEILGKFGFDCDAVHAPLATPALPVSLAQAIKGCVEQAGGNARLMEPEYA